MSLDEASLGAIRDLAKRCTAHLSYGGKTGTGFFIDDDLLLTCAHVVGVVGTTVEVRPYQRALRTGEVVQHEPGNDTDIALVRVSPLPGEATQPAVVIDRRMTDNVAYYAVGYPINDVVGDAGQEELKYQGHPRNVDPEPSLLVLDSGQASVTPGLSGGPVINGHTGAVVAIVQYRAERTLASGGGAIPIARAAKAFREVDEALAGDPVAAREWREALGRDGWRALGRPWGWARRIDLYVDGDRRKWTVKAKATDEDAITETYSIRNLSDEIPTGLFNWAERRRIGGRDEAALVGRLLSGALLPAPIVHLLNQAQGSDQLLVRLHLESAPALFDVPWEYAAIGELAAARHIAKEDGIGFARIVPHPSSETTGIEPATGRASVLGIVVHPTKWQREMPVVRFGETKVDWPKPHELYASLESRIVNASTQLTFEGLEDPAPSVVSAARPFLPPGVTREIVHYIGFGKTQGDKAWVALSDGAGDVDWIEIDDLFESVRRSGARLLVAQFLLLRGGADLEPVRPSAFKSALGERLNAVVFTRFPSHPRYLDSFNTALYEALGAGMAVERAVQRAREVVYRDGWWGNPATFGSFTLMTGPSSDMTLLPEHTPALQRQGAPVASAAPVGGARAAAQPRDVFSRDQAD